MAHEVPASAKYILVVEDQSGQRANMEFNVGFLANINVVSPAAPWTDQLAVVATNVYSNGGIADLVTAVTALTNAKIVHAAVQVDMDWAAEPTGESGSHKYVQEKARLHFEDGQGLDQSVSIPAPVDSLFLSGVGMQTVVDPSLASGGGSIATLMTAVQLTGFKTRGGGTPFAQFFGGQLVVGKPPRRRRIQGQ